MVNENGTYLRYESYDENDKETEGEGEGEGEEKAFGLRLRVCVLCGSNKYSTTGSVQRFIFTVLDYFLVSEAGGESTPP